MQSTAVPRWSPFREETVYIYLYGVIPTRGEPGVCSCLGVSASIFPSRLVSLSLQTLRSLFGMVCLPEVLGG